MALAEKQPAGVCWPKIGSLVEIRIAKEVTVTNEEFDI